MIAFIFPHMFQLFHLSRGEQLGFFAVPCAVRYIVNSSLRSKYRYYNFF